MTRWTLLVMTAILMLGRVLVIPVTLTPALQLSSHNCSQTAHCPVTSERPPVNTTGSLAGWGRSRPGPRITLSLDVPLGLLRILLEQARVRAAKEQAAANAQVLARVGRR
ncbi:urocortin-2 [Echinops telfairi]|uniref:Urocortin-2 n=1 Tax=Echinops telfairi TaxID=9371 RepID=A0ABM0INM7_ECHTE|nr:urocortin-2 [Echinops telfairi]